jgi:hypothetical protein
MRTHYGPWQPCWISNQHQQHKSGREPSNEHLWQVWLKSVQRFQRRRVKCEKLTDAYPWQKLTWPMAWWAKKMGQSYGSWIYNYLCNQCLSPLTLWVRIRLRTGILNTLCDKVCQWLAAGLWFSAVSSTNKTDHHDITEITETDTKIHIPIKTINITLILLDINEIMAHILNKWQENTMCITILKRTYLLLMSTGGRGDICIYMYTQNINKIYN